MRELQVTSKMSGWKIDGYKHIELMFNSEIVSLKECMEKVQNQETMDYILDNFRFYQSTVDKTKWLTTMDYNTLYKITILDRYPEEKEFLEERFGKKWLNMYLRFGH